MLMKSHCGIKTSMFEVLLHHSLLSAILRHCQVTEVNKHVEITTLETCSNLLKCTFYIMVLL